MSHRPIYSIREVDTTVHPSIMLHPLLLSSLLPWSSALLSFRRPPVLSSPKRRTLSAVGRLKGPLSCPLTPWLSCIKQAQPLSSQHNTHLTLCMHASICIVVHASAGVLDMRTSEPPNASHRSAAASWPPSAAYVYVFSIIMVYPGG